MNIDPALNQVKDCLYRVAVKAIVIQDGKTLLVKDNEDIGWSLPGGGVDHGEDTKTALIRELSEEIGVTAESIMTDHRVVSVLIGHSKDGIPRCNLHFVVKIKGKISVTGEINSLQWFSRNELQKLKYDSAAGDLAGMIDGVLGSIE